MTVSTGRPALTVLILAAGKGKRLRSKTIKLLHPVAGRPMVVHVVEAARGLRAGRLVSVIGHDGDRVREALAGARSEFVLQEEQRGTGHAVLRAAAKLRDASAVLILNGDLPLLRTATLRRFVARHNRSGAALSLMTANLGDPTSYGRIIRDPRGRVARIVEERDATHTERRIREVNCGIYCADPARLLRALRRVRPNNVQGEYYITDAVRELIARGHHVTAVLHADSEEVLGVNTRRELAHASRVLYARKADELQDRGVTILDARRTWIDPRSRVGRDSILYPDVIIEGRSILGENCIVRPGCRLTDAVLDDDVEILDHCVVWEAKIAKGVRVGPFAHLRPGSVVEGGARVGNFVELKKTRLGAGSKANHLAYLGDATIGSESNIGAGTITCNYDGERKHATVIGRGVFIGSNSQIVAPVTVEDGAYVAAGSTVTQDVPAGALAIGRSRQRNVEGWAARRKSPRKAKSGS